MDAIRFENVWKSFRYGMKRSVVLRDFSIAVSQGEIFGFLGPNGAGKSTAIKLLLNFIRPDKGSISVEDFVVGRDKFRHLIGYLPEVPCYYDNLTGQESVIFAGKSSGFSRRDVREKAHKALRRLDLETAARRHVRTYSKGMKQRLGLAMALIHDPQIYILDEPMTGLDPLGRQKITDVILELREKGKTVFFSSHILSDVERLCDRVGILNKGKLLFTGPISEIKKADLSLEKTFVQMIEQDEVPRDV